MWEKEILLVTSNFSFSHIVFKRLVLQIRKNQGLFGKRLMPFSTVFQLYSGGQRTYPCFPGVLLTSTLHNILSKPLAAFPLYHCRNNRQQWGNESCPNDYHQSSERILAEPVIKPLTSCSQVLNAADWAMGLGDDKRKKEKMGKEEHIGFLNFSGSAFKRLPYQRIQKIVDVMKTLSEVCLTLYHTIPTFNNPKEKSL